MKGVQRMFGRNLLRPGGIIQKGRVFILHWSYGTQGYQMIKPHLYRSPVENHKPAGEDRHILLSTFCQNIKLAVHS